MKLLDIEAEFDVYFILCSPPGLRWLLLFFSPLMLNLKNVDCTFIVHLVCAKVLQCTMFCKSRKTVSQGP